MVLGQAPLGAGEGLGTLLPHWAASPLPPNSTLQAWGFSQQGQGASRPRRALGPGTRAVPRAELAAPTPRSPPAPLASPQLPPRSGSPRNLTRHPVEPSPRPPGPASSAPLGLRRQGMWPLLHSPPAPVPWTHAHLGSHTCAGGRLWAARAGQVGSGGERGRALRGTGDRGRRQRSTRLRRAPAKSRAVSIAPLPSWAQPPGAQPLKSAAAPPASTPLGRPAFPRPAAQALRGPSGVAGLPAGDPGSGGSRGISCGWAAPSRIRVRMRAGPRGPLLRTFPTVRLGCEGL